MKTSWIVLTVLWVLAAGASVFLAMMSFFLFDAPGSESSKLTIAFFLVNVTMPLWWILGAVFPWIFQKWRHAVWLFAIPALDVAAMIVVLIAIEKLCGGSFACR